MFFKNLPFCLGLTTLAFLALSACGGDSSSGGDTPEKVDNVSSVDKLPDCTDDLEGDTVLVKDVKADYVCTDGEWASAENQGSTDSKMASSSSTTSVASSSDSGDDSSSSIVTTDMTIKGASQKGPFLKGSKVSIQELESGRSLNQTGSTFSAVIQDNDGKFKLNARSMVSQYIELQVEGYYRNEVTGESSDAPLTLWGITDVSKREGGVVNINLLTHLEYFYVVDLVKNGKMKVFEAKEKAQKAILSAFYVKGDFASSEDLDIFSKGDGNAALLAISVLMQSNLDVAHLTEFLTDFASDIEEDGEWDDETAKARIADWTSEQDLSGGLTKIRENVANWKLGTVPEFEKYVRNFWYTNYGLNECKTEGEVLAVKNTRSKNHGTKVRYICKSGAWVEASTYEKDTYGWTAGTDGQVKKGDVTDTIYVFNKTVWQFANNVEMTLGMCSAAILDSVGKVASTYHICKSSGWREATPAEYDTYKWSAGTDGEIKKGNVTDAYYKYDKAQTKWISADALDVSLNLSGCTTNRDGDVRRSSVDNGYYICEEMAWRNALPEEYDTYGQECTSADVGKIVDGVAVTTNKYYCGSSGWILIPMDWSWDIPKGARLNPMVNYGTLTESDERGGRTYKTVTIGTQTWMAENLNYEVDGSWCYDDEPANCEVAGRLYNWFAAFGPYGENGKDVCPDGWHLPTKDDWTLLFNQVSENGTYAARDLKTTTGWGSYNGNDTEGFSALPAGVRFGEKNYQHVGLRAYFWTATYVVTISSNIEKAYYVEFRLEKTNPILNQDFISSGHSVRCVKDSE